MINKRNQRLKFKYITQYYAEIYVINFCSRIINMYFSVKLTTNFFIVHNKNNKNWSLFLHPYRKNNGHP